MLTAWRNPVRHILSWKLFMKSTSAFISSLPLIQGRQLSVTGESMGSWYWRTASGILVSQEMLWLLKLTVPSWPWTLSKRTTRVVTGYADYCETYSTKFRILCVCMLIEWFKVFKAELKLLNALCAFNGKYGLSVSLNSYQISQNYQDMLSYGCNLHKPTFKTFETI